MRQPGSAAKPLETPDLPLDVATVYPEDDGFFGRRAKVGRKKLLAGVADAVRRALAPGETIRFVARGVRHYWFEQVFGGAAVAQYQNMTALVLTDRRLLLLQLDRRGRIGDIKNEVPLAAIRGAGRRVLGAFGIRLADGSKLSFASIPGADRKRLEALLPSSDGPKAREPSVIHLCPACLRAIPGAVGSTLTCPQPDCRIPFRDPVKAARLSALVPGLGDLYLRHHLFGSLEFLGSMMALGVGVALALGAAANGAPSGWGEASVMLVLLIGLPRIIDHRLTLHMGRKGLVPLALAPAPGAQARNLPSFPRWSPLLFVAGLAVAGAIVAALSQDLRHDAALREASGLAAQGRFDDARARWDALQRAGGSDPERTVKFALALLQAGDLEGADDVRAQIHGDRVETGLAERWNAALAREQTGLADYTEGVQALVGGDPAAWTRLDRALAYFQGVKRPHLPQSRGEIHAHLAMGALAEPLVAHDLKGAQHWLEGLADAPSAEVAAVRAAYDSATGGRTATARDALARLDDATLPVGFRLLALEARARVAEGAVERAAVKQTAEAFPRAGLDEDGGRRLASVIERAR